MSFTIETLEENSRGYELFFSPDYALKVENLVGKGPLTLNTKTGKVLFLVEFHEIYSRRCNIFLAKKECHLLRELFYQILEHYKQDTGIRSLAARSKDITDTSFYLRLAIISYAYLDNLIKTDYEFYQENLLKFSSDDYLNFIAIFKDDVPVNLHASIDADNKFSGYRSEVLSYLKQQPEILSFPAEQIDYYADLSVKLATWFSVPNTIIWHKRNPDK